MLLMVVQTFGREGGGNVGKHRLNDLARDGLVPVKPAREAEVEVLIRLALDFLRHGQGGHGGDGVSALSQTKSDSVHIYTEGRT